MKNITKKLTGIFQVILLMMLVFQVPAVVDQAYASEKKVRLSLSVESGDKDSPQGRSIQMWSDLVSERTNGRIRINTFFQGELGGQQELFDQIVRGNLDMLLVWPQTSYDKRLGVNHIPYLVIGWEDAIRSFGSEGWLKELFEPIFADVGLKYFGPYPEGFGGIATKKRYATNYESAQGLKVRSQPIFPLPQTIKAMGFQPVPIDWNEVYTSIQTGVVDGDSSNVIYWDFVYFGDQLDYFVHSEHNFSNYALVMNNNKWLELSTQDQQIIEEAAQAVIAKQFADAQQEDEKWIKTAQEGGMKYVIPSNEEKLAWINRVRAEVWPQIEKEIGSEIMETIRANASVPK